MHLLNAQQLHKLINDHSHHNKKQTFFMHNYPCCHTCQMYTGSDIYSTLRSYCQHSENESKYTSSIKYEHFFIWTSWYCFPYYLCRLVQKKQHTYFKLFRHVLGQKKDHTHMHLSPCTPAFNKKKKKERKTTRNPED